MSAMERDTSKYTIVNLPRADREVMLPEFDRLGNRIRNIISPRPDPGALSPQDIADYYYEGGTQLSTEVKHFNW